MPTTISASEELADELYSRKQRGESYEDVIWRLLERADRAAELEEGLDVDDQLEDVVDDEPEPRDVHDAEPAPEPDAEPSGDAGLEATVGDVAEAVLPGSGEKLEQRRAALLAAVEYLREQGTATPAEFEEEVYPEHPAGYTAGKDPARSWWKNCIYKGLRELAERTDEVSKADHTGEWRYTGDGDARP